MTPEERRELADRLDRMAERNERTAEEMGGLGRGWANAAADLRAAAAALREDCCSCNQGDDVKQTIELTDEEKVARVYEAIGAASACWNNLRGAGVFESTRAKEIAEELCRDLGLTVPAPAPEPRAEYALYRLDKNGHHVTADEVLVAAHSLRVGERVEWAPGDWREITDVEDHRLAITLWFGDEPFSRNRWDLVAVRR